MNIEAVDLFCGIGGLTYGVSKAGIAVVAGIDIDASCEYAYTYNNRNAKFILKSIDDVEVNEIYNLYSSNSIKVLMGCAPCQPFSRYSDRYNKNGYKDDKWKLLYEFMRIISGTKPDIISMENVPKLSKTTVFADFLNLLRTERYFLSWNIVNCANYGVPQQRKRLVLLASKKGNISLINPTHSPDKYITVRKAIGKLEPLNDGEQSESDLMHRACKLTRINKQRIKQSVPGGSWENWDETIRANCHLKSSGITYKSIYGRMEWDKPSPTITTQFYGYGNGRFGHPEQDRALTFREGAILQSFPKSYKFYKGKVKPKNTQIGTHIGNAVPVQLGKAIGVSILKHIEENDYGRPQE